MRDGELDSLGKFVVGRGIITEPDSLATTMPRLLDADFSGDPLFFPRRGAIPRLLDLLLDLIICRVGSGSGRVTSGFGSKNIGPFLVHDMVGSGLGWIGLARNFVCNFRVESSFFSFGSNISVRT